MIYFHTFHMPSSNGSLVMAIKLKLKYRCHTSAIFYILLIIIKKQNVGYFRRLYYHIPILGPHIKWW
jgi:uncharacterized membrane protein YobD (UPF0266 family)